MPPNILMIVTDQERSWGWLSPLGADWFRTNLPGRQRLLDKGMRFDNYFVHTAPCSPNRSILYTGKHIDQTGVYTNVNLDGQDSMSPDIKTIGDMLKGLGYKKTAYKGKFHLVKDVSELPTVAGKPSLAPYGFDDWDAEDNDGAESTHGTADPVVADHAVDWLKNWGKSRQPWFLAVNFVNPHDINDYPDPVPTSVPSTGLKPADNVINDLAGKTDIQSWWQKCLYDAENYIAPDDTAAWTTLLDTYVYWMKKVDAQIVKVLDAFDKLGLASNTVIVFTSDHGELAGAHTLKTKGPEVYHESKKVPLVIVSPETLTLTTRTTPCLASTIDLVPTLLSYAGSSGSAFGLRGKSLKTAVTASGDTTTLVRSSVLFTYCGLEASLGTTAACNLRGIYSVDSTGEFKFARYYMPGQEDSRYQDMQLELYDLERDQTEGVALETVNRAWDPAYEADVQRLNEQLDALYNAEVAALEMLPGGHGLPDVITYHPDTPRVIDGIPDDVPPDLPGVIDALPDDLQPQT